MKLVEMHRFRGLPVDLPMFTWREAMMRAQAAAPFADGRVTVRREEHQNGMHWTVRYECTPNSMNAPATNRTAS